jgi:hypothetical protein
MLSLEVRGERNKWVVYYSYTSKERTPKMNPENERPITEPLVRVASMANHCNHEAIMKNQRGGTTRVDDVTFVNINIGVCIWFFCPIAS